MAKAKGVGSQIIAAMQEVVAIERGEAAPALVRRVGLSARSARVEEPPVYDKARIAKLREALELSQPVFAGVLNVSPATVRAWEQGTREPEGAAVRLLQLAEEHPALLRSKVQSVSKKRAS